MSVLFCLVFWAGIQKVNNSNMITGCSQAVFITETSNHFDYHLFQFAVSIIMDSLVNQDSY